MNNLSMKKFLLILFTLSIAIGSCNAQLFHKNASRNDTKVKEPKVVLKAQKKQAAKDRKLKKDYSESIKKSQKRTRDIQTPEVQARMKQNKKDTEVREKTKKKKFNANSEKAGKKYK
jgi:hypothetical protein